MTDCALQPALARRVGPTSAIRRPSGIPRWTRLLGVTVCPVDTGEGARSWVLTAGAGPAHVTAVFPDLPSASADDLGATTTEGSAS